MWGFFPRLNIAAGITIPEVRNQLNPFSPLRLQSCKCSVAVCTLGLSSRTQGPPLPPIVARTWTYLHAVPSALRINSNTDNGFERILYWRTIGFFQGADTEKKRDFTLSLYPHSDICVRPLLPGLNSGRSPEVQSKVGGLCMHYQAARFLETVLRKGKSPKR